MNRFALLVAPLTSIALLTGCASDDSPPEDQNAPLELAASEFRSFRVRYVTQLTGLPKGKRVQVWIPVPADDEHQKIGPLEVEGPWKHQEHVEPTWGNRMLYFEATADAPEVTISVSYDVDRRERRADLAAAAKDGEGAPQLTERERFLQPSKLVVIGDEITAAHKTSTPSEGSTLAKARAYYDHVLERMAYDKSGEGWGRGDSTYACSVGKGNCTDYHAFFQALCMAEGIPSRFAIGLYGDYALKPEEYRTGGYHCWAEFFVPGYGWVPVDISEGDKDPEKVDYFFGAHSPNRVTLSTGRDLDLKPKQAGPPLNFFVYPYVEVDGTSFAGVKKTSDWTDRR